MIVEAALNQFLNAVDGALFIGQPTAIFLQLKKKHLPLLCSWLLSPNAQLDLRSELAQARATGNFVKDKVLPMPSVTCNAPNRTHHSPSSMHGGPCGAL